jgi:TrmH family RNA methyltransferase
MTITSATNQHLTEIRKLSRATTRARTGRFVVEGEDFLKAAAAAGVSPLYVLCAQGDRSAARNGWLEVAPTLLAAVSELGSSSRVIAVFEERWGSPIGPLAVALWGLGDPGNVGAIVRSAQAFGASCVALGPGTADPYGRKAVRASMGAIFGTTLARVGGLAELPGRLVALVPAGGEPLEGPFDATTTLLLGGEREGLPPELVKQCHEVRHIRQVAGDSLNAAMAATVALYEATRMAAG